MIMPFGAYAGLPVECIPLSYLRWTQRSLKLDWRLEESIECVLADKPVPRTDAERMAEVCKVDPKDMLLAKTGRVPKEIT